MNPFEIGFPITDEEGNDIGFAEMQGPEAWCTLGFINNQWVVNTINPFGGEHSVEHKFTSEEKAREYIKRRKEALRYLNE